MGEPIIGYRKNRRINRIRKNADNAFTAHTGAPAIKLTGTSNCLVTSLQKYQGVPARKISYALAHNWQQMNMGNTKVFDMT